MSAQPQLTWHVDTDDLLAYRRGEVHGVSADSIEAHLIRCAECRAVVASEAPTARRDERWEAIAAEIDRPSRWNRSTTWVRLAVGTPHLAAAGVALAVLSIMVPLAVGLFDTRAAVTCYLALVPAAPILGVVLAYRAAADPAGSMAAATPLHAFSVVVMRTVVLLAAVLPAGLLTAVLLPGRALLLLGWFLPTLAACTVVLAVGTRFDPRWTAGLFALGWAAIVWSGSFRHRLLPVSEVLQQMAFNQTLVQATSAVVAVLAVAWFTGHRDDLAYGGVH